MTLTTVEGHSEFFWNIFSGRPSRLITRILPEIFNVKMKMMGMRGKDTVQ